MSVLNPGALSPGLCHAQYMAVTVAQYETHLDAARSAAASQDWAAVLVAVGAARACRAALPNMQDASGAVAYSDAALNMLEKQARIALNSAAGIGRTGGPIQRSKITYKRTSAT